MFPRIYTHTATALMLLLLLLPGWLTFGGDNHSLSQNSILLNSLLIRLPLLIIAVSVSIGKNRWRKPQAAGFGVILLLPLITIIPGVFVPVTNTGLIYENTLSVLLMIFISLVSAFSEELLFRSWMIEEYEKSIGPLAIVILSSGFFSIIHLWQGPWVVLYSFLVGILYSAVYLKFRNIWVLIAAHSIHNVVALWLANIR